jgi:membrane protein implicated in regulation of membrane protease activity
MRSLTAWVASAGLYFAMILAGTFLFIVMLMIAVSTINLDARAPAVQVTTVLALAFFAIWSVRRLLRIIINRSFRRS